MKRIIYFLCLCSLFIFTNVNAQDYELNKLIPVDTIASVKTEKFDYNNFVYSSSLNDKEISTITFESIKNNTHSKLPVSINILLFGNDQKNIGFLTYCSDKDLSSNYSGFKISGEASAPFSINVARKYFIDGKSAKDVKYIAVMDENKYCHIGGYDKYKDLTIDEIVNGVGEKDKTTNGLKKLIIEIQEKNLQPIIIGILISLAILVIIIMIVKVLIKKLKNKVISSKKLDDTFTEETIDLSYSDKDTDDLVLDDDSVSIGNSNVVNDNDIENSDATDSENDEESDLTNLFK
ncbi:MAG: hypothetical protein IJ097_01170 [Bacilli bacterium]|nr:hypothetical protein [Bacilli bacterium]